MHRINFKIDHEIFNQLDRKAQKLGVSKASLIRKWLKDAKPPILKSHENSKPIFFNFILDDDSYKILENNVNTFQISQSYYLRLLIQNNLSSAKQAKRERTIYEQLWKKGRLKDLVDSLNSNIEKLSNEELIYYAKANLEMGYIYKTSEALKLLEERSTSKNKHVIELNTIKADVEVYKNNIENAKTILKNSLTEALLLKDRSLIGRIYAQLGEISYLEEDFIAMQNFHGSALEYYDVFNYPIEVSEIYMILCSVFSNQSNKVKNDHYLSRAKELINSTENTYYKGWFLNESSMSNSSFKNIKQSHRDIIESFDFHKRSGSTMKTYYSYCINAKVEVVNNNYSSAISLIEKAKKLSQELNVNSPFATVSFLELFIMSKYKYAEAIRLFEERVNELKTLSTYKKYLLSTAKYLHGPNEAERQKGKTELIVLNSETKGEMVKYFIEKTLAEKIFQPIR